MDVILEDRKLSLVFEYLDLDLKILLQKCPNLCQDFNLNKVEAI